MTSASLPPPWSGREQVPPYAPRCHAQGVVHVSMTPLTTMPTLLPMSPMPRRRAMFWRAMCRARYARTSIHRRRLPKRRSGRRSGSIPRRCLLHACRYYAWYAEPPSLPQCLVNTGQHPAHQVRGHRLPLILGDNGHGGLMTIGFDDGKVISGVLDALASVSMHGHVGRNDYAFGGNVYVHQ